MAKKYRVFVSYARKDAEKANEVIQVLKANHITYWFDRDSMESTENFRTKIESSIKNADAFLFLMSEYSMNSPNCQDEVIFAENFQKRIFVWHIDSSEPNSFTKMHMGMINRDEFYCFQPDGTQDIQEQKRLRNQAVNSLRSHLKELDKAVRRARLPLIIVICFFVIVGVVHVGSIISDFADVFKDSEETSSSYSDSDSVPKGCAWTEKIFWNDDGVFQIDTSLLGMNYTELSEAIGVQLPELSAYTEVAELEQAGYTWSMKTLEEYERRVVFIFNPDGRLAEIAGDILAYNFDTEVISALQELYGTGTMSRNIYQWAITQDIFMHMYQADNQTLVRQEYGSYSYYQLEKKLDNSDELVWLNDDGMLRIDDRIFGMTVDEFLNETGYTVLQTAEEDGQTTFALDISWAYQGICMTDADGNFLGVAAVVPGTLTDEIQDAADMLFAGGETSEMIADNGLKFKTWNSSKSYSYSVSETFLDDEPVTMQMYTMYYE